MTNTNPPIVSIIGRSGVGKTTFLTKLIPEFKRRGYRVAVIKHRNPNGEHHVETDQPGKDTWKHFQAGADTVMLATAGQLALFHRCDQDPSPDKLIALLPEPVDLIFTEGYKQAGKPAIELVRAALGRELVGKPSTLIALVTDIPKDQLAVKPDLPRFGFDDTTSVADFLETHFSLLSLVESKAQPPAER